MVSVGRVSGPVVPKAAPRRVGGADNFAVTASPAEAAGPAAAASAASLDGMLLLQEGEDGPTRDRQARRHGRAMLDGLTALQRELLENEMDAATLQRLAALAEHCPQAADPALRATIAAVSLRVQVELARRAM